MGWRQSSGRPHRSNAMTLIFRLLLTWWSASRGVGSQPAPACPIPAPCQCIWDNQPDLTSSSVNVITCADRQLTEDTLPPFYRSNLTFYKLDLSKNNLDGVPAGYLEILRDTVSTIDLSHNLLRTIPDAVRQLPNLDQLWLIENNIDISVGEPFIDLENLNFLALSKNEIQSIQVSTFQGLRSLQQLLLDGNQITEIADDAFQEMGLLHQIDLSKNALSVLRPQMFAGLTGLQKLVLNYNHFQTIPADAFSELSNLQSLELKGNTLRVTHEQSFQGLDNVVTVDMSNNDLTSFPSRVFQPMSHLRSLNLGMNRMTEVRIQTFRGISPKLNILRFSFNPIHDFPEHFFDFLPELEVLLLSGLPLVKLPNMTSLSKLTGLSIAGTSISQIFPCEWESLVRLKTFSMANCPLLCDCSARWLHQWYSEHLDEQVKQFTETRAPWTCKSPPELTGRNFHELTTQELVCPKNESDRWCDDIPVPHVPAIELNVYVYGSMIQVHWNSTSLHSGRFRVLYYQVDTPHNIFAINVSQHMHEINFSGLPWGKDYMICIEHYSRAGQLQTDKCHTASTPNAPMSFASGQLALALALPMVIILLACVCVAFFYWRKHPHGYSASTHAFENAGYAVHNSEPSGIDLRGDVSESRACWSHSQMADEKDTAESEA